MVQGGVVSPADAALMMLPGSDGVFVGSGIFKSECHKSTAKAHFMILKH